eukprot:10088683-Alexandrium_andersonii.AAC.1
MQQAAGNCKTLQDTAGNDFPLSPEGSSSVLHGLSSGLPTHMRHPNKSLWRLLRGPRDGSPSERSAGCS